MSGPQNQEKFIKETFDKVHANIIKFILDTNYAEAPSIKLRNELEEYKSKMLKKETQLKKQELKNNQNLNQYLLPLIENINNPNKCIPNSALFSQKLTNKNILKGFQDINKIQEKKCKKFLKPKNLNLNSNNNLYMDKYYKFNNDIKNRKFFHPKIYDKYNNTVIRNKDISLGLYDMNVKKLIPKGADVTLTMKMWGHPLKITGKEVKNAYKKCSSRDEVASGELNKIKPNKYSLQEFYKTQPTLNKNKKNKNIQNMTTNSFLNNNTKY